MAVEKATISRGKITAKPGVSGGTTSPHPTGNIVADGVRRHFREATSPTASDRRAGGGHARHEPRDLCIPAGTQPIAARSPPKPSLSPGLIIAVARGGRGGGGKPLVKRCIRTAYRLPALECTSVCISLRFVCVAYKPTMQIAGFTPSGLFVSKENWSLRGYNALG